MLRRTGTFDPVCFLIASLSRISKAKTVKRTLLQIDNFFQSSDKKATCFKQIQMNITGIFEKQRIKLNIFVNFLKKTFFYTFKTTFFWISFCSFEGVRFFLSWTLCLFFQIVLCNQPTVVLRHWKWYRTGTFKPYPTPLWTIGFSSVTYIKGTVMQIEKVLINDCLRVSNVSWKSHIPTIFNFAVIYPWNLLFS